MPAKFKWLLLPPAIALILFMGPLRDGTGATVPSGSTQPAVPPAATAPGEAIPAIPAMDQIVFTLLGVLILGAVGIIVIAKLRKPMARGGKVTLVEHKQTLRVTAKHHVHVLQFGGELLLLGTCDSNMSVLQSGESIEADADELELATREDEDEGAVPKDMIIPRPANKRARAQATLNLSQFNKLLAKAKAVQI